MNKKKIDSMQDLNALDLQNTANRFKMVADSKESDNLIQQTPQTGHRMTAILKRKMKIIVGYDDHCIMFHR